jgi:hypothetical protein
MAKILYLDGTEGTRLPTDEEVLDSLAQQIDDFDGELDDNTMLVAPLNATEEQVTRVLDEYLEPDMENEQDDAIADQGGKA